MLTNQMQTYKLQSDPDALLTEVQVGQLLGLSIRTLQAWRVRRAGPPFVQVGRAIRYRRSDLVSWIDANTMGSSARPQI
jgi:predicted DNA-binding transcriptional regulator AlpA